MFYVKGDFKIFSNTICDALRTGDNNLVMSLLQGVNIQSVKDTNKKTLLHMSAAYDNLTITEHLVQSGCMVDAKDDEGNTPLLLAVYYRHAEIMQLLINVGADLCCINSHGRSPAFYAKIDGDCDIMNIIRSAIKNKQADKKLVLKHFMESKWSFRMTDAVRQLCNEEELHYSQKFSESAIYGDDDFKVYNTQELPLIKAVFLKDMHQVRMNLKYGINAMASDGNGCTALHAAATIISNRSPDSDEQEKVVQLLLSYGADINVKDRRGETPLHVASAFCNSGFMRLLLQLGADVNARDALGRTPLHVVFLDFRRISLSRNNAIKTLIEYGADIYARAPGQAIILEMAEKLPQSSVRKFILKSLARQEAHGKSIDNSHLQFIQKYEHLRMYYDQCKKELATMKERNMFGSMSFFNMLTYDIDRVASYARNKDFRRTFRTLRLKREFPIHYKSLKRRFSKGVHRMWILKVGEIVLSHSMRIFDLDHLVIRKILSYINTRDLQSLCQ